ncbi:MAG: response regulator, partial [Planctomycetota bacterium]
TRFRPDLILLDIMMPGMTGYEVCKRIRRTPQLKHTKIIMISAKAMIQERLAGYEAGADDYLTKPFDHDELLAKIQVHLRLRASEEVEAVQAAVMANLGSRTSTPMSGILGPLELLLSDEELSLEERGEFIASAYQRARDLQEFFGHVLKLTALKSRSVDFSFDETSVIDLVNFVTMEYAGGPIDVECELDESVTVPVDNDEMTTAIRTLIDGALKRSGDDQRVRVHASETDDGIRIIVRDYGEALATDEVLSIFEEGPASFASTDAIRRATAQQILWGHGGDIGVDSDENGTSFAIWLPKVRVGTPA